MLFVFLSFFCKYILAELICKVLRHAECQTLNWKRSFFQAAANSPLLCCTTHIILCFASSSSGMDTKFWMLLLCITHIQLHVGDVCTHTSEKIFPEKTYDYSRTHTETNYFPYNMRNEVKIAVFQLSFPTNIIHLHLFSMYTFLAIKRALWCFIYGFGIKIEQVCAMRRIFSM